MARAESLAASFIEELRQENETFYGDPRGRGALKDLQQTFPHPWLYVAELIQNAVDEGATRLNLETKGEELVLEHDGRPFEPENVRALCARGVSSKGAGTVGFMGVGFKAVFRSFDTVRISSGEWRFRLSVPVLREEYGNIHREWLGAVLPFWDEHAQAPSEGMNCRFVLSGRVPGLPPVADDVRHVLGDDLALLALLARRGFQWVRCAGQEWGLSEKRTPREDGAGERIEIEAIAKSGGTHRRWILFSTSYIPSADAIARFLEHRDSATPAEREKMYAAARQPRSVEVFCELGPEDIPLVPKHGHLFALLPTGLAIPLGLHVQADWLLAISRRELMQIDGNAWQEEILCCLPRLLRHFLEWLVSKEGPNKEGWNRGYDVLPDVSLADTAAQRWFGRPLAKKRFLAELGELAFLPAVSNDEAVISEFISPTLGRLLPLNQEMEKSVYYPRVLFGGRIVSREMLGLRARTSLKSLGMLTELIPVELQQEWQAGRVGEWLALFPEEARDQRLADLLGSLAEAGGGWKNAPLRCIPTEAGTLISRAEATRLPPDWSFLSGETTIQENLRPYLPAKEATVALQFDNRSRTKHPSASTYLAEITTLKLEELVFRWWESLPVNVTLEQQAGVRAFTCWVRGKQAHRKQLIRKLLAVDSLGRTTLRPIHETLLADPYAAGERRHFFPRVPVVAAIYLEADEGATRADWQSFFESLQPSPRGPFSLEWKGEEMYEQKLRQRIGSIWDPPTQRSGYARASARGIDFDGRRYLLLDCVLPSPLRDRLTAAVLRADDCRAIISWLNERLSIFRDCTRKHVAYIPRNGQYPLEYELQLPCSWVTELRDRKWLFALDGTGPYKPADVLADPDPLRPDAPVAGYFPAGFAAALEAAGISWGSAIPRAPAVRRLQVEGPTASPSMLHQLFQEAVVETRDNPSGRELLARVLTEHDLFPVPEGGTPDGKRRIPWSRVIRKPRIRSDLGRWIVAIESFPEGSAERALLAEVDAFDPTPETTSMAHVLSFLEWVYHTEPDADRVRHVLPLAYQYLQEELQLPGAKGEGWKALHPTAKVFVQRQRCWAAVNGPTELYFDDLPATLPRELKEKLPIVTSGHLGNTEETRHATVEFLGLQRLSNRFLIRLSTEGVLPLPGTWARGFKAIQDYLREMLDEAQCQSPQDEEPSEALAPVELSRYERLQRKILDHLDVVASTEPRAILQANGVAVSGAPDDFAPELCQVLFELWGLGRRRLQLVELSSEVTHLLGKLDSPQKLERLLHQLQTKNVPKRLEPPTVPTSTSNTPLVEADVQPTPLQAPTVGEQAVLTTDQNRPILSLKHPAMPVTKDEVPVPSGPPELPSVPVGSVPNEVPIEEPPDEPVDASGGDYTSERREATLAKLHKKIEALLALGPVPQEAGEDAQAHPGSIRSDDPYRKRVLEYERAHARYPDLKPDGQPGHDVDSYSHPEGHPERRLVRRIEVKGRSARWTGGQIVTMTSRQFVDALERVVEEGTKISPDFDYWLYVVEREAEDLLNVIPIRNPATFATRFEIRGGTWRHRSESGEGV
ncbi:sacsin N-terminal ATP-binding-like domain-containing protein [Pyxidicoccus caerfyrddinensis]|uniref:sacsin N-terminal ATP-binding-like domain-containing protein n=1 Tax=Pyxidicoccus caerfyrddinensis TaxID=2709663 RepID=UPI0013D918F9|nr:hypothetical protein [Pyxidicoccus caerfyrddinensis]